MSFSRRLTLSVLLLVPILTTALTTESRAVNPITIEGGSSAKPAARKPRRVVRPAPAAPAAPARPAREESVDLNSLTASPPPPAATPAAATPSAPARTESAPPAADAPTSATQAAYRNTQSTAPNFKVYFDLDLVVQPGLRDFTFDNYHSFLFFEIQPTADLQFSFDVNPQPRYYELDYQIHPRIQLRAGRIWIPWDDLSPHNIYGGRVNVSRLQAPGTAAFLPDLWTDMGIGAKFTLFDQMDFNLTADLYVVNGFHDGGADPSAISANDTTGYPSFADSGSTFDNNKDKAIGGRVHALLFNRLGLGASFYTGRWNNEALEAQRLNIIGFDGQLKFGPKTEFRVGVATFLVDVPNANYNRGGFYTEIGQKLGADNRFKLLARFGVVQLDSRVIDITDQTIGGVTLLWQPGLIQYSLETSYDFNDVAGKPSRSYTAARIVVAL